jgi:hypothetical protein
LATLQQGCVQRADVFLQAQQMGFLKAFAAVEQQTAGRAVGMDLHALQR